MNNPILGKVTQFFKLRKGVKMTPFGSSSV